MYDASIPFQEATHRVAITGTGIVTSMGLGWAANAEGFRAGDVALRPVTLFDTSQQRAHQAGEVLLPEEIDPRNLSQRDRTRLDRASKLLLHAGYEAWDQAGWGDAERTAPMPIVIGTSAGGMALGEAYYKQALQTPHQRHGQTTRVNHYQPQSQVLNLLKALGITGPISIISNACASGANAVGQAFRLIKSGMAPRAVCGGYDALCQLVFAGFDSLQALSATLPRPFDANRDGLALGEGAAVLMLESWESAQARGADILGEVVGYGACTDIHHLTQPHPEGTAALTSMRQATTEAGLRPDQIGYINSHGTGTPLNDTAEGAAIQAWAGESVGKVAVSSTKAAIGHLLGGAGAVETIITLMALREGWLPPSINIETPDPICTFDLVRTPRDQSTEHALTNSFGFGGSNATVVLRRAS